MSSEASVALSTVPFMNSVASATSASTTEGLRAWTSSTSARESLPSESKNLLTRSTFSSAYRSSAGVTTMFRPLTNTSMYGLPSVGRCQPSAVSGQLKPATRRPNPHPVPPRATSPEPLRYRDAYQEARS
jgi:hypothetical protein